MKFKIGDQVKWSLHPDNKYVVMATKDAPASPLASYANQPVFPPNGTDYLVMELESKAEFTAYEPAMEFHLQPL
jgi:hypothetical protein